VTEEVQLKRSAAVKNQIKLVTVVLATIAWVSIAQAQTIPEGPAADPYWRQFLPRENVAVQGLVAPGGPEADPYWRQFLPRESTSALATNPAFGPDTAGNLSPTK
jgi:hypothetical protein